MKFKEIQVVKIGSQALFRDETKLDFNRVDDLCLSLRHLRDKEGIMTIVVTSGAVALGKQLVNLENVKNPILRDQMYASVGQPELVRLYAMTLNENVSQLLPTHSLLSKDENKIRVREMIYGLIESDTFVIINYNDSVDDNEMMQVSTYTDNDRVAEEIALLVGAKRLIILTTVDGLYDKNNEVITEIKSGKSNSTFDDLKNLCGGKNEKGTGGMRSKVEVAENLSGKGIETIIANAKYQVHQILDGKDDKGHLIPKTIFRAEEK